MSVFNIFRNKRDTFIVFRKLARKIGNRQLDTLTARANPTGSGVDILDDDETETLGTDFLVLSNGAVDKFRLRFWDSKRRTLGSNQSYTDRDALVIALNSILQTTEDDADLLDIVLLDGTDGAGTNATDGLVLNASDNKGNDEDGGIVLENNTQDHIINPVLDEGIGGYELTGGFKDRLTGNSGASDIGSNVDYTQAMAEADTHYRFGFDRDTQILRDAPYWTDDPTDEDEARGSGTFRYINKGVFSGEYLPPTHSRLIDFSSHGTYNTATTLSGLAVTAADGSFDFSEGRPGDLAKVRFDFNVVPRIPDTTIIPGLIWSTRDASGNITFTFFLAGSPIFFDAATVGKVTLCRPLLTGYFASKEDVRACALPAIKSDQAVYIQPLTTLVQIER
tara:strand:- start:834 stop:2012 length:1179 start_codon:yes stop_codon:yes gene_type:complete